MRFWCLTFQIGVRKIKIIDWFRNIFQKKSGVINLETFRNTETSIAVEAFALITTVELIAGLLAKCEFKTFQNGAEIKGLEWYNLNIRPNVNQNSTQFWQEVFCKLLYQKEVLIIPTNSQKIIADDFQKTERAVTETYFTNVSRGDFNFQETFRISDVYYLKYSNFETSAIIHNIFEMYTKLMESANGKYQKSGGEKGILEISALAQGDANFETKFQNLMSNYFKSYFSSTNAVLPLFDGYKYTPSTSDAAKKYSNEISDIKVLMDEALARSAQAFKIPPALIKGDVAGLKDAYDIMLTNCIDPLADMISEELTGKQFTPEQVCKGSKIVADTSCIKHIDIFDIAANIDKLISCGFASIDETRDKAGLPMLNTDFSQAHYITKNYERSDKIEENQ